jgi:bifunctional non-homologous end joining protein LigD
LLEVVATAGDRSLPDRPVTKHGRWGEGITAEDMVEMQWVKPSMVVEVSFAEWTAAGVLRHPAFVALRDDKRARDVHRA